MTHKHLDFQRIKWHQPTNTWPHAPWSVHVILSPTWILQAYNLKFTLSSKYETIFLFLFWIILMAFPLRFIKVDDIHSLTASQVWVTWDLLLLASSYYCESEKPWIACTRTQKLQLKLESKISSHVWLSLKRSGKWPRSSAASLPLPPLKTAS